MKHGYKEFQALNKKAKHIKFLKCLIKVDVFLYEIKCFTQVFM